MEHGVIRISKREWVPSMEHGIPNRYVHFFFVSSVFFFFFWDRSEHEAGRERVALPRKRRLSSAHGGGAGTEKREWMD